MKYGFLMRLETAQGVAGAVSVGIDLVRVERRRAVVHGVRDGVRICVRRTGGVHRDGPSDNLVDDHGLSCAIGQIKVCEGKGSGPYRGERKDLQRVAA